MLILILNMLHTVNSRYSEHHLQRLFVHYIERFTISRDTTQRKKTTFVSGKMFTISRGSLYRVLTISRVDLYLYLEWWVFLDLKADSLSFQAMCNSYRVVAAFWLAERLKKFGTSVSCSRTRYSISGVRVVKNGAEYSTSQIRGKINAECSKPYYDF